MPRRRRPEQPELGRDALEPLVQRPASSTRWGALLPARRAALGLGATVTPSVAFVLAGFLMGPQALGLISTRELAFLDSVVSVALAMLGVFIGLALGTPRDATHRPLLAATAEAAITIVIVTTSMYVLFDQWSFRPPAGTLIFALVLGICACASAAVPSEGRTRATEMIAARIADLDDIPLIGLGAFAVAVIGAGSAPSLTLLLTVASGLAVGTAGWLLFERAEGEAERGVLVVGAIVLLGGLAAFIDASPLLSGCVAAVVWVRAPGAADRVIAADLRKLQHPLVALLLLVAGASIQLGSAALWIAAPLVLFRFTGKLAGSAIAARLTGVPAALIGTVLLPPGILGIALALNVQQTLGTGETILVSAVTLAAVGSEALAAMLVRPYEEDE